MGFLDRFTKSDEEKAAEDLAEQEAEQAQAALAAGGIPPKAQRRLAELRASGDDAFFTSTLSVPEALLVREDGLRPVTQVMGSSIYHVGWQYQRTWTSWGGDAAFQELTIVARAWNEARRLAFSRMYQEARQAGAHAVVGVRVDSSRWEWARDAIEFIATGTAVREPGREAPEHPALTDLSGQDYWKLREAGHQPVGAIGATASWLVLPSRDSRRAMLGGWFSGYRNQEIPEFVQGTYHARNQALGLVWQQAQLLRAEGIVGMQIAQDAKVHRVERENGPDGVYMIVTLHVLGTAIVSVSDIPPPKIKPVISLSSQPG
jgi:uncharacterized protein YbjQ (UPF0145 family)